MIGKIIQKADMLFLQKPSIIIAIDGGCASGKSTLADELKGYYEGKCSVNVLHMDDFFLPNEKKTKARFQVPGNNVDRERFEKQVLLPLCSDTPFLYQPFDCHMQSLVTPQLMKRRALNIVEGAYCLHPTLMLAYDLKIFLTITQEEQRARITKRNGKKMLSRFISEWIPMENAYFEYFQIKEKCDLVLKSSK